MSNAELFYTFEIGKKSNTVTFILYKFNEFLQKNHLKVFGRSLVSYNKLLVVLIKVWKLPKIFVKFQPCSKIEINSLTCIFHWFHLISIMLSIDNFVKHETNKTTTLWLWQFLGNDLNKLKFLFNYWWINLGEWNWSESVIFSSYTWRTKVKLFNY